MSVSRIKSLCVAYEIKSYFLQFESLLNEGRKSDQQQVFTGRILDASTAGISENYFSDSDIKSFARGETRRTGLVGIIFIWNLEILYIQISQPF